MASVIALGDVVLPGTSVDGRLVEARHEGPELPAPAVLGEAEVCNAANDFDTKDCILRKDNSLPRNTLTAGDDHLHFLPNGLTSNGPITFTLTADDCRHQQQRSIIITRQGHTIITKQPCP